MYILLDDRNRVKEIIPDINPDLPGVPIEERYPANFIDRLLHVDDNTDVPMNYEYDPETDTFFEPEPDPEPEYIEIETEPTEVEQLRADVDYIAIMTGVEL